MQQQTKRAAATSGGDASKHQQHQQLRAKATTITTAATSSTSSNSNSKAPHKMLKHLLSTLGNSSSTTTAAATTSTMEAAAATTTSLRGSLSNANASAEAQWLGAHEEAETFRTFRLSLRLDPFKRAAYLIGANAFGLLAVILALRPLGRQYDALACGLCLAQLAFTCAVIIRLQRQEVDGSDDDGECCFCAGSKKRLNAKNKSQDDPEAAVGRSRSTGRVELALASLGWLSSSSSSSSSATAAAASDSQARGSEQQNKRRRKTSSVGGGVDGREREHRRNEWLTRMQFVLLISSCATSAAMCLVGAQLIAYASTSMFIIYTLLAIDNKHAFAATLAANLIHLLGVPLLALAVPSWWLHHQQTVYGAANADAAAGGGLSTPLLAIMRQWPPIVCVYAIFHSCGLYLNKHAHDECLSSFNDIKACVSAKLAMDVEDKRLTRLMESVIPKHLAGRMRQDVLGSRCVGQQQQQHNGIFQKIYLDSFDNVSILFADIVNFTKISSSCSAALLVETLNELFGRFDKAADANQCLRIKILGDCYYCVSGIPDQSAEHAARSVEMGLDMIDILGELAAHNSGGVDLNMRVGIHSGRVLCGVLGQKRWQFDVHSNDVKLANHTEQSGVPGRVHITEDTLRALNGKYRVEPAEGHLRDSYLAQRNLTTYFVISPANRAQRGSRSSNASAAAAVTAAKQTVERQQRPSSDSSANLILPTPPPLPPGDAASSSAAPAAAANDAVQTTTAKTPLTSTTQQEAQQQQQSATPSLPIATTTTTAQQEPAMRFRTAVLRLINVSYFIRTADAPFSNLADAEPRGSLNLHRVLLDTIVESQRSIRDQIDALTLKFKDNNMSHLYASAAVAAASHERPRVLYEQATRLLIYLVCVASLSGLLLFYSAHSAPPQQTDSYALPIEMLLVFVLALILYAHQHEHNARRSFLWRQLAMQDKQRMALMRDCNRSIFFNVLPPHVASYFLEQRLGRSHMDLYHKSYERIGVVFASISNFSEFYSEVQGNQHGFECLRLLNEIICDFDSILDDARFVAVDKIKTIGSTYMAAIGLSPNHELPAGDIESNEQASAQVAMYLQTLVKFVIEMNVRLDDINTHSYNNFKLRVGINVGPVTAGVIGATKPLYDIWGNTVNVASRMESTAEANKIQITDEVYDILQRYNNNDNSCNFVFTCRGSINVKGKGFMTTYYLDY